MTPAEARVWRDNFDRVSTSYAARTHLWARAYKGQWERMDFSSRRAFEANLRKAAVDPLDPPSAAAAAHALELIGGER